MIRQQALQGISVSDVVRELSIARGTLEQRFVKLIGRTPAAEIRRVRIEEAKHLLIESDKSIADVGKAAGFGQQDLFPAFSATVSASPPVNTADGTAAPRTNSHAEIDPSAAPLAGKIAKTFARRGCRPICQSQLP